MYRDLKVFSGNSNKGLAKEICRHLSIPLSKLDISRFSNDNLFIQVKENVREKDGTLKNSVCGAALGRGHKAYTHRRKCGSAFHLISAFSEKAQKINIRLTYREHTLPRSPVNRIGFAGLSY
jgi:phosphoribosylpyrophosphate synthetase